MSDFVTFQHQSDQIRKQIEKSGSLFDLIQDSTISRLSYRAYKLTFWNL